MKKIIPVLLICLMLAACNYPTDELSSEEIVQTNVALILTNAPETTLIPVPTGKRKVLQQLPSQPRKLFRNQQARKLQKFYRNRPKQKLSPPPQSRNQAPPTLLNQRRLLPQPPLPLLSRQMVTPWRSSASRISSKIFLLLAAGLMKTIGS